MTTTLDSTAVSAAAAAAAAAVVRCLPAADLAAGSPVEGAAALGEAIPGGAGSGAKAVSATLAGAVSGTLVLLLSAELAAQVEAGPVGPQELVAGLEPALTDAAAALVEGFGEVRHEAALVLDAEVALANVASHDSVVVVPIAGAGGLVATLVVCASAAGAAVAAVTPVAAPGADFETLSATLGVPDTGTRAVELLNDVEMGVTAELGRTRMTVRELLALQPGSVVELDRAAGSPVDLLVNGTLVARGEVVVIDEEFGVRITEIIGYDQKK